VAGPYGRPHIRHDHPAALRLRFNITHTDDAVFLAVALDRELGVDVESTARREPSLQIADHHFARAEAAALYALPAEQRQSRFFEYWTLKEAYIKARSMGLFLPLNSFSFHFPTTTQVELRLEEGHPDRASRWRFRQLSISPSLVVAICEERQGGAQSTLVATKTVPLVSDRELPYTLLRESVEDGSVQ
jgi:4'-phosphopantetheinyl transferase